MSNLQWTNAPVDYDYPGVVEGVSEVEKVTRSMGRDKVVKWRLVRVLDEERFNRFQIPRYGSGFRVVFPEDGPDARTHGLVDTWIVRVNGSCVYDGADEREAMEYQSRDGVTHVTIRAESPAGEVVYEWES